MFRACLLAICLPVLLLASLSVRAAEPAPAAIADAIRAQLAKAVPKAMVTSVSVTPMPGIYRIELESDETAFVNADASWLISGDLFQVTAKGLVNQTERERSVQRAAALAKADRTQMITFPAKGKEKAAIYVFTDVDCGYCRKLHQEIGQINAGGVTVHYLAFPRAGMDSDTGRKMNGVWCALDRAKAMTVSKQGNAVPPAPMTCKSPVEAQYRLGVTLGVRGTPAVFDGNGEQLGGYVPAAKLVEEVTR